MTEPLKEIKRCDDCFSLYYADTSPMANLCPDCSHQLYDYPNCEHQMEQGRCIKCYWGGMDEDYINKIENN